MKITANHTEVRRVIAARNRELAALPDDAPDRKRDEIIAIYAEQIASAKAARA